MIIERPSAARGAGQCRLARQPAHVLVRPLLRPAVDGLRPAAGDQRGPRRARRGLPAASPRQHGNPQLRAGRRARAPGQQRRRRRAAPRRAAVDERRPRHRAQRVQRVAHRAGAFPADLDPARPASTRRRRMRSRRSIPPRAAGAGRLLASPDGARRQPGDPPAGVAARRAAGRGRIGVELTLDPARRYWLHVAQGAVDVDGRALAAGDALGFVDEAARARACRARRRMSRTCCCSTCRL